jgi:hypothetical protein
MQACDELRNLEARQQPLPAALLLALLCAAVMM